jgi:phenylacetate-CoA ligase
MNNILKKIKHHILNKSFFLKNYNHCLESQYLPYENLREIQTEKLKHIIEIAVTTVPYYMHLKREINFSQFTLDELNKFPIVTKDIIRAESEKFISITNKNKGFVSHTSGSTGKPFEFLNSYYSDAIENMAKFRAWGMGKDYIYKPKSPIIVLRTYAPKKNEPLYKIDKKNNYWYLSPFDINEKNLSLYLNIIKTSNAKIIRGYASSIYIFTLLLKEHNVQLPQIKTLVTSSETLLTTYREVIEDYWQIPILDWYGQNENTITVQQCWAGNYHNNDEYGIVELDEDNQILATSLNNNVMPFIRYATGDIAVSLDKVIEQCPCGRTLSISFKSIKGRTDDILIKDDGTRIPTANFSTAMKNFSKVKQFKIIQQLDKSLLLQLVAANDINAKYVKQVEAEVTQRLGHLPIRTEFVDQIKRDKVTGKIKVTECYVGNEL